MKYLDTTKSYLEYNSDLRKYYDKYKFKFRSNYLNLIDKNFYKKIDLDFLVSSVAEKNISSSYTFHNICLYFSIKQILSKKKVDVLFVENEFLKKNIQSFYKGKIQIKNKEKISIINIFRILLAEFSTFFITKFFFKKKISKDKINLIDIFVTNNNCKIDRYYKNYFSNKKSFFLVPTFVNFNIFNLINCFYKLNKKNYIFKSQFLTFKDIFFSFNFIFRINKIRINKIFFKGLNIDILIQRELYLRKNLNASIVGLQNYLFAKNLKNHDKKLKSVLNWSENSSVDKGWNYGFRSFFPRLKTYGYQGYFVEKKLSSLDITQMESKAKTCPEYIMLSGPVLKKSRSEFVKNIKFIQTRAFRFEYLFSRKFYKNKKRNQILILLNLDRETCIEIIEIIKQTKFAKSNKIIFIKEHPLLKLNKFYKKNLPENFKIIDGNLENIVKKFRVIITSGCSSSVYESLLSGSKIIFPMNDYYDKLNLEMLDVPKSYYKVCNNITKLDNHINYFLNQDIKFFEYYKSKIKLKKVINDRRKISFLKNNNF